MPRRLLAYYLDTYRGLPRNVWLISLTLLVNRSGTMVLPFIALYMKERLGLPEYQVGWLIGAYGLGAIAGSYLGGALSDRFGAIRVQVTSLLLTGCGFLLLMLAPSPTALGVALFLLAVVADAYRPAAAAATAQSCPAHLHPRAFALNRLAVNLGMSIGPVIGGFLAEYDFRWLFVLDGATCFAAAALTYVLLGKRLPAVEPEPERQTAQQGPTNVWRDFHAMVAIWLMFLSAVVFFQILSTYTVHLRTSYGLSTAAIGMLFAVNTIMIVVLEMGLVRAVEHLPKLRVLAWGCLFSCVGLGLIGFGSSVPWAVASMVVMTIGEMLSSPIAVAYISGRAVAANRGGYLGVFTLSLAAAFALAPVLGMWLYGSHQHVVWWGAILIGAVCFFGYRMLDRC